MPGPMSKDEVLILADASSFSRFPRMKYSPIPPRSKHQHTNSSDPAAVQYAGNVLAKLPNFFASRETVLFMDTPPSPGGGQVPANQSLLLTARANETVLYRLRQAGGPASTGRRRRWEQRIQRVSGEFGPIRELCGWKQAATLSAILEQIDQLKIAVFRYAVAKDKSHYEAEFCCGAANSGGLRSSVSRPITARISRSTPIREQSFG